MGLTNIGTAVAIWRTDSPQTGVGSLTWKFKDYSTLEHKAGAYSVPLTDLPRATQEGYTLVFTSSDYLSVPGGSGRIVGAGLTVIDTSIHNALYRAVCPHGPASCHRLSPLEQAKLATKVTLTVERDEHNPAVAGYLLVDENPTDFAPELKMIAGTMRRLGAQIPTVCAVGRSLPASSHDDDGPLQNAFERQLRNVSPQWCDAILLYGYAPLGSDPRPNHVDWTMSAELPKTLAKLRTTGWDPTVEPLIGVPQAFVFNPRVYVKGGKNYRDYFAIQSPAGLAQQTTAFCEAGADSVIAYAWNDSNRGGVSELGTNANLRQGFRQGLANCRRIWAGLRPSPG
ncbi:hypothetical protein [Flexivirga sp.]|uniref:hypothetical protein n=1 Tax=Flexivirga sp. TaxID=1962927 RepID=UPI003F7CFA91